MMGFVIVLAMLTFIALMSLALMIAYDKGWNKGFDEARDICGDHR